MKKRDSSGISCLISCPAFADGCLKKGRPGTCTGAYCTENAQIRINNDIKRSIT